MQDSDVDILVVGDEPISSEIVSALVELDGAPLSLSRYTWSEIERMATYGSLFLHHLRLEAHPIFEGSIVSGRLHKILGTLPSYNRVREDYIAFRTVAMDVKASLLEGGFIPFELSVLATVVRHACILGCYLEDRPTFGRFTPVNRLVTLWDLDKNIIRTYSKIYSYKLFADKRIDEPPTNTLAEARNFCEHANGVLDRMEEIVHGEH